MTILGAAFATPLGKSLTVHQTRSVLLRRSCRHRKATGVSFLPLLRLRRIALERIRGTFVHQILARRWG
jgi:hypothetical protein